MRDYLRVSTLVFMLLSGTEAPAESLGFGACLVNFCVNDTHTTEKAVVKKLGAGVRVYRPDDEGVSRCYYDPVSKVWADFTFTEQHGSPGHQNLMSIMLSEHAMCNSSKAASRVRLGPQLAGVSVGMTEVAVRSLLGQPVRIDDAKARNLANPAMSNTRYSSKFGDTVYVYGNPDEIDFMFIFFTDGRVRTVWFSHSE